MAQYRGAVIGLGWMGMLYDLAKRLPDRFDVDDIDRPTPQVNPQYRPHHWEHPGTEGLPTTYAEALRDRPEVELVAAADRDEKRLAIFRERYGVKNLYTDAEEMLRTERPEIVGVSTNTKGRVELTCLAVECGARGIMTEKPISHILAEADRMVKACAEADVPLVCGSITTTHPSFGRAKELVGSGTIGEIVAMEASGPSAQHQNWSYFLDSAPAWVVGIGDEPRRESGSDEFAGQGLLVTVDGRMLHFRKGAPGIRLHGTKGEITFDYTHHPAWRLWQDTETPAGNKRVEVPCTGTLTSSTAWKGSWASRRTRVGAWPWRWRWRSPSSSPRLRVAPALSYRWRTVPWGSTTTGSGRTRTSELAYDHLRPRPPFAPKP